MSNLFIGVLILFGLVGLQAGSRYWTVSRTKKAWEAAQEALRRDDLETAEREIGDCIKRMPLWLQPRFLLGALLAEQGKLEAAEEHLQMALALQPRDAEGHIELGIFYVTAAGRPDDGLAAFEQALAHDEKAWRRLETDPRLASFRETEAYASLTAQAAEG